MSPPNDSESKRIKSVNEMIKRQKQQKNAIHASLLNIDSKPKNKIIFDDSDSNHSDKEENLHNQHDAPVTNGTNGQLFESDETDDDEDNLGNIENKASIDSRKYQKLWSLQLTYKDQQRFALDERFVESDDEDDKQLKTTNNQEVSEDAGELSLQREKQKEMDILKEVLGSKLKTTPNGANETSKRKFDGMLRYDSTQNEHDHYQVNTDEIQSSTKKKRKKAQMDEEQEEKNKLPEVSKEVFYKVTGNLKNALEEKQEFSLLRTFGNTQDNSEEEDNDQEGPKQIKKASFPQPNPFHYESSDNEEPPAEPEKDEMPDKAEPNASTSIWTQPFFIRPDDYRLQEGLDFVLKMAEEHSDFGKVRRDLKEITKSKVRHAQRKNRPFKKKLGGVRKKKMIRMKKVLKR